MSFAFSFSGDDIEEQDNGGAHEVPQGQRPETGVAAAATPQATQAGAFPVQGKPQLPPVRHSLETMLDLLPSKVAYDLLEVELDDGRVISLPRRELWDVRVQMMAEDDGSGSATEGLGAHDVRTGVYEGGFKSWESSVDLVKELASQGYDRNYNGRPLRAIELGCGTALPSLSLFQSAVAARSALGATAPAPLSLILADYNPTVLQLVTMPNFLLAWALELRDTEPALAEAFSLEDELELSDDIKSAFQRFLVSANITLDWLSGGWSEQFVDIVTVASTKSGAKPRVSADTLIIGAETIYSPFALESFYLTVMEILRRERGDDPGRRVEALVGAKRLYFGVGGSLDDFVTKMREGGALVEELREDTDGVRRGVIQCRLASP